MTDSADMRDRLPGPALRSGWDALPFTSGDESSPVGSSQTVRRLVERSLGTADSGTANDIHQWGQYVNSRMALHVLARLACPDDPEAVFRVHRDRARLENAALNLEAVCAIASSIALKARSREERSIAVELFDLARRRLRGRFPAECRELHVMTAYLSGRGGRAKRLATSYGESARRMKDALRCQDAHPRNGGSPAAFMRRLRSFADWPELSTPEAGEPMSIDRLRTAAVRHVAEGPLISVIMTCFEPDEALLTAVRSIAAQSWQNWELLLVDDGSGPRYDGVLREAASIDPRVKLLIQPENAGTYQARNRAMAAADGEFMTGLDSDDWAHPRRLERQARRLIENRRLVMVESLSIAVHEDLALVIDPQVAVVAARSTPIMIRSGAVMERVGFYDEVRKTADSEYRCRVKAVFGRGAVARMSTAPATLVRHSGQTLSSGEVSRHWMSADRLAYHSGFTHWHRRIAEDRASPFLEALARPRPFPISGGVTRTKARNRAIEYERVYAADWRWLDEPRGSMLDDAADRAGRGASVGLVHCPEWVEVDGKRPLIGWRALEAASRYGLDFIDLEPRYTGTVIVPSQDYAELLRFEYPALPADRVRVFADCPREPAQTMRRRTPCI
ncbi:glycosyltransferase family 2 protein [Glycomyces tenuis]|uniref:glycosyltransferase family 2 protein n=1 Tax=Glycomyces tenuis TaxID=58116 RepID=UPI00138DFE51|nr:glycosyltransferase family A protein [Glycomyces tenuis]